MALPILAVTPNPSIDKIYAVRRYHLGSIHRPESMSVLPGGKGLNVARTIKLLGGQVRALLLAGGHAGRRISDHLQAEQIDARLVWFEGETRESISVLDPESRQLTEIYERGPAVDRPSWDQFESVVRQEMEQASWVVFSGSLPQSAPVDGYARMIETAQNRGVRVLLDTSGAALRAALPARPYLVKVNAIEAGMYTGKKVDSPRAAIRAATAIRQAGAKVAIVTMGAEGAAVVENGGIWQLHSPKIDAVCAVGSGDAFLGGLGCALQSGQSLQQGLELAAAAGAANSLTVGAGNLEVETIRELRQKVQLHNVQDQI